MAEKEQAVTLHISELPVLQVLVIGFHHHKGSTVEYNYPPLNPSSPDQSLTSSLPSQWKPLPHIALPDGCHNYQQGHVIFTLLSPSSDTQVYGISCYRQIESKELLSPSIDVTRSTIQKAVCVISRWPTCSVIESKLRLATHAYFNSKDFNDISILVQLYDDLTSTLTVDHALSVVTQGYDIINIVFSLQHKVLQIFKAILLQKRVMVFGSNAGITSSCVMSIVSLFPSFLESLINPLISKDNEHGLPLNVFPKETSLQPYLSLQQMDILTNLEYSCVLVGAVNPLYFKQHNKLVDIMYNIDLNHLYTNDSHSHNMLKLSSTDLRFCNVLLEAARTQIESNKELSVKPTNWYGSDEWIRTQFKSYLLGLLATTLSGDSVAFDDYNLEFVKNFMKTQTYLQWIETPHDGILKITPRHVCEGELSLSDLKRQLTIRASDYGLDTLVTSKQVGRVMQETGRVISATKDSIHNTVSSWWTNTSSAVITWWGDTASQDVESEEEEEEQEEKVKENVVS